MQRWDLFCRVVDNYGDIGTCWRLAQQLANECDDRPAKNGKSRPIVRLWVDDLQSFARLCPSISTAAAEQRVGSIEIRQWLMDFPSVEVADVVVEAFACELPAAYVAAMVQRAAAPVWINLEYLSAEKWVEDCHLLTSPHPSSTLKKHFFFPGFTSRTGGVLRERDFQNQFAAFDSASVAEFWNSLGIPPVADGIGFDESGISGPEARELRISLFCYDNPALPQLLQCWADGPSSVRVLATPGAPTEQISNWLGQAVSRDRPVDHGSLTVHALPFLSQPSYDRLLWACDVNFVRGEDSFVRAQWAQRPFVWQIYPQAEDAHQVKLDAFLSRYTNGFGGSDIVRCCWKAWNGVGDITDSWRNFVAIRQSIQRHGKVWAFQLDQAGNLANNLFRFAHDK